MDTAGDIFVASDKIHPALLVDQHELDAAKICPPRANAGKTVTPNK